MQLWNHCCLGQEMELALTVWQKMSRQHAADAAAISTAALLSWQAIVKPCGLPKALELHELCCQLSGGYLCYQRCLTWLLCPLVRAGLPATRVTWWPSGSCCAT